MGEVPRIVDNLAADSNCRVRLPRPWSQDILAMSGE